MKSDSEIDNDDDGAEQYDPILERSSLFKGNSLP
jgi:hypothetical protein